MLTRLYIDNYRCFVNFEHKPARQEVILGRNGAGKSSFMDAVLFLRQVVVGGDKFDDFFILRDRTIWLDQPQQVYELEAVIGDGSFTYRLVIEPWGDPAKPRVAAETVHYDSKPIFEFSTGEVHLFNDRFEHKVTYDFDWSRSALATIMPRKDNVTLTRFKRWLSGLFLFRINPFAMGARAEGEHLYPNVNLSNFASWYRHLVQSDPKQTAVVLDCLRESLDGFGVLQFDPIGENVSLLTVEFTGRENAAKLLFNEMSDGQRCLVCLYAILHFVVAKGGTVIIDEPDNFVSLREIQPWLMSLSDVIEEGKGQVLLISHHPEIINQWAPGGGVQFMREGFGPVRVKEFRGDPESTLTPAELVARGWENE